MEIGEIKLGIGNDPLSLSLHVEWSGATPIKEHRKQYTNWKKASLPSIANLDKCRVHKQRRMKVSCINVPEKK